MTPYSTAREVTSNGYKYIFRAIPSDVELAEGLVDYFIYYGLKKIHLCYVANAYGLSFANSFEKTAEEKGLDIVDRVSYDVGDKREFNRLMDKWENYDFDSIIFVGSMPEGATFYKILAERNINVPVISGDSMVRDDVLNLDKDVVEGKVFPSIFHVEDRRAESLSFIEKFRAKYGEDPSDLAAIGLMLWSWLLKLLKMVTHLYLKI